MPREGGCLIGRREKGVRFVEDVELVDCASAEEGWKIFSCAGESALGLLV